jgi:hypothetical protein
VYMPVLVRASVIGSLSAAMSWSMSWSNPCSGWPSLCPNGGLEVIEEREFGNLGIDKLDVCKFGCESGCAGL